MFYNNGYNQDWSTLKKLVWLRGNPATGQMGTDLTVSGAPPLSLPNSLGKPLKAWSVDLLPYQEGTGDPAPDNVRPIHGTDKLTIYTDSKYGGLVNWNQEVQNLQPNSTVYGITRAQAIDGNMRGIRYSGTSENTTTYTAVPISNNFTEGHKYLYDVGCDLPTGCRINLASADQYRAQIVTITAYNKSFGIIINNGTTVDFTAYPMAFDLTQMFGAGNEPITVAEFNAMFDQPYYPYDAGGTLKTVDQVNGSSYTPAVLTLPQTVYTGTIGSEGGESRSAYRTFAELGADTRWSRLTSGTFAFYLSRIFALPNCSYPLPEQPLSTHYTYTQFGTMQNETCRVSDALYIVDNRFESIADFRAWLSSTDGGFWYRSTPTTFAVPSPTIPTPSGNATTWATAEDGTVDGMEVTYVGKA